MIPPMMPTGAAEAFDRQSVLHPATAGGTAGHFDGRASRRRAVQRQGHGHHRGVERHDESHADRTPNGAGVGVLWCVPASHAMPVLPLMPSTSLTRWFALVCRCGRTGAHAIVPGRQAGAGHARSVRRRDQAITQCTQLAACSMCWVDIERRAPCCHHATPHPQEAYGRAKTVISSHKNEMHTLAGTQVVACWQWGQCMRPGDVHP